MLARAARRVWLLAEARAATWAQGHCYHFFKPIYFFSSIDS